MYRVGVAETRDRTIVFVPFVITWIGLLGASHASVFSNKSLVSKRYEFSKSPVSYWDYSSVKIPWG